MELVIETTALDTGGAIRNAMDHVFGDTVLAVNGDSYFMVELGKMAAFHHMCGADCTIAVKQVPEVSRYGGVELNKDYSISSFREKGMEEAGLINGGVYLINTRLFRANHFPMQFSFEKDYLQHYFREKRIYAVRQEGYFIDIGIPEDLVRAQQEIIDHDKQLDAKYQQGMDTIPGP
jgi:D-glycero-alpha-D-manno-heptose 1-phosphate guanylyltransferase